MQSHLSSANPGSRRVAVAQIASPDDESPQARIERVEDLLRQLEGVDLVTLPELWSPGYFAFDRYSERAETLDGPTVQMAQRVARDLGSEVHLGSIVERGTDEQLHNTAVLVDATGRVTQTYRKIHVFGYQSQESQLLTPGHSLSVTPAALGATASTTCYDLRFPGLWQELSARGAESAIVPAAWPAARREHWRLLTQARAVEHQLWIIATNACGSQSGVELGGFSRVIDPAGRIVAECGDGEEVLIVDIEPAQVGTVRAEFPVIDDRLSFEDYRALSE